MGVLDSIGSPRRCERNRRLQIAVDVQLQQRSDFQCPKTMQLRLKQSSLNYTASVRLDRSTFPARRLASSHGVAHSRSSTTWTTRCPVERSKRLSTKLAKLSTTTIFRRMQRCTRKTAATTMTTRVPQRSSRNRSVTTLTHSSSPVGVSVTDSSPAIVKRSPSWQGTVCSIRTESTAIWIPKTWPSSSPTG